MWFAYMDETGNTGRNLADPDQPIHLIVTVALDESLVMTVHDHARAVAARHLPGRSQAAGFEFHGHALFAGSGHFAGLDPAKRIEIYDELLQAIAIAEAKVIVRGVYKPGLAKRYRKPYHPHDIALMFTIESIERMARDHGCHVLLVADESREIEDAALRDLASYQTVGTAWGWNTERIDHIIDTIHFVRSETNPAIQLADCAAFIAARQRKIERREAAENPAVTRLWEDHIEPHPWRNSVWFPPPPGP
jgi:hypothetical protein